MLPTTLCHSTVVATAAPLFLANIAVSQFAGAEPLFLEDTNCGGDVVVVATPKLTAVSFGRHPAMLITPLCHDFADRSAITLWVLPFTRTSGFLLLVHRYCQLALFYGIIVAGHVYAFGLLKPRCHELRLPRRCVLADPY